MRWIPLFFLLALWQGMSSQVPYSNSPNWISTANGHYATGLGLADINGDGWKDLVVANGNDMARQRLVVYYNTGDGTFPVNPGWQSDDIDYHGHLSCADLDADGDIDVVVSVYIGAGGFSSPGKIKIYYNQGTHLESTPSYSSVPFYTFSCALGDADGDGDLDIAVAAGEPYGGILDYGKIFLNDGGVFPASPSWQSDVLMGSLDVEFGDVNRDGLMDVIFACEGTPNMIYLGIPGGMIGTAPAWQSAEPVNYINSVDIGYTGNASMVVMTENSQLGGDGKVRKYDFDGSVPASSAASWYSNPFGYGSGIILNDVDLNGQQDLIYGGWWLPVKIALAAGNGFELTTSYTSVTNSVVEAILLSDLGRQDEVLVQESIVITNNGSHIIILEKQIIEGISQVLLNGTVLQPGQYCHIPGKPWLSVGQALQAGDMMTVDYYYSPYPDMVITNWDSNKGNYIFYNTEGGITGTGDIAGSRLHIKIYPNPADDHVVIDAPGMDGPLACAIYSLNSQLLILQEISPGAMPHKLDISGLSPGTYLLVISNRQGQFSGLLVK